MVTYGSDNPIFLGRDMETHNSYSEETAGIIDEEVHKIIEEAHERAVQLLTEKRSVLDNMARLLIERETIYTDEVDMLMNGDPLEKINEYMDTKEKAAQENPFKKFDEQFAKEEEEKKKSENDSSPAENEERKH